MVAPVVPTREFSFLRYCKQIEPGLWAVADVSPDALRDVPYGMPPRSRRLPSGCLIADMSNGYSNVRSRMHALPCALCFVLVLLGLQWRRGCPCPKAP